jgi:hypothetical protein
MRVPKTPSGKSCYCFYVSAVIGGNRPGFWFVACSLECAQKELKYRKGKQLDQIVEHDRLS